ncbi:isopenicillin N synthase family dioxygenase [Eisenibacter elegans]|uniref:isopenicillin N synthase family dioxygenase n=1 Tax=Eisenibacter elegans TaxID=997 RepID=UPI000426F792|nr:2-oxoglutarate and iron-dependent oxygenase domain-containing protein [Eisenibacter elegans]
MDPILYNEIPSVDLADFANPERKPAFVQQLGEAFTHFGFVAVKNHGLSEELRKRLYEIVEAFFAQPEQIKQQYEDPELAGQRGYTGKGKEHAKDHNVGDLKEFFQIGQTLDDPNDPLHAEYPPNIFPKELATMEPTTLEAYRILEQAGAQLLRAIALYLNLDENYFDDKVHKGNSILRCIHYFPITNPEAIPEGAVRAAAHGDINLITLLMGASAEGLEVQRLDGKWIPITALPDQLVVNVGDMLDRLTNHVLKSTIHRVVNPPRERMGTSRYSIPFFMHPRAEMDLTCLANCVTEDNPKRYTDITAGAFLDERLREIGLKK